MDTAWTGRKMCQHGHLHRDTEGARICEAAHRWAAQQKPELKALIAELREVVARNAARSKPA